MNPVRMGVIGVGHLGKEHARILSGLPHVALAGVVDANPAQAQAVAERCGCPAYPSPEALLPHVDAVSVVVPTTRHLEIASAALQRNLAVFVEKPLAENATNAKRLADLARDTRAVLQVGHIERFNPAFEELRKLSFQPQFIQCERLGSFTGRSTDVGVVLDLMIHDLDLLLALVAAPVVGVEALGMSVVTDHEDIAQARLTFANGCIAHVSASRVSRKPVRGMQVWAPEGFAQVDFAAKSLTLVQPSESSRRRRSNAGRPEGAGAKDIQFGERLETCEIGRAEGCDQLTAELTDFIYCVRSGSRPRVNGDDATAAIVLAEQVLDSLQRHAWHRRDGGPRGPFDLPAPLGPLFSPVERKAAA